MSGLHNPADLDGDGPEVEINLICNALDIEDDEHRRAEHIDRAIELADTFPVCKKIWEDYR